MTRTYFIALSGSFVPLFLVEVAEAGATTVRFVSLQPMATSAPGCRQRNLTVVLPKDNRATLRHTLTVKHVKISIIEVHSWYPYRTIGSQNSSILVFFSPLLGTLDKNDIYFIEQENRT